MQAREGLPGLNPIERVEQFLLYHCRNSQIKIEASTEQ